MPYTLGKVSNKTELKSTLEVAHTSHRYRSSPLICLSVHSYDEKGTSMAPFRKHKRRAKPIICSELTPQLLLVVPAPMYGDIFTPP